MVKSHKASKSSSRKPIKSKMSPKVVDSEDSEEESLYIYNNLEYLSEEHTASSTPLASATQKQKKRKGFKRSKNLDYLKDGEWSDEEHQQLNDLIIIHGNQWKKIGVLHPTRTSDQCKSHAQKFKDRQFVQKGLEANDGNLDSPTFLYVLEHWESILLEMKAKSKKKWGKKYNGNKVIPPPECINNEYIPWMDSEIWTIRTLEQRLALIQVLIEQSIEEAGEEIGEAEGIGEKNLDGKEYADEEPKESANKLLFEHAHSAPDTESISLLNSLLIDLPGLSDFSPHSINPQIPPLLLNYTIHDIPTRNLSIHGEDNYAVPQGFTDIANLAYNSHLQSLEVKDILQLPIFIIDNRQLY